CQESYDTPYSF
nr:immunoglobulin light chain junction region [Macaca mulatta]